MVKKVKKITEKVITEYVYNSGGKIIKMTETKIITEE